MEGGSPNSQFWGLILAGYGGLARSLHSQGAQVVVRITPTLPHLHTPKLYYSNTPPTISPPSFFWNRLGRMPSPAYPST